MSERVEEVKEKPEVVEEVAEEVVEEVKPTLEERLVCVEAEVVSLTTRIEILVKAEICAGFSEADRKVIVDAFKGVHGEIGKALGVLAQKDISNKTAFDSKRGVLLVQLFKV